MNGSMNIGHRLGTLLGTFALGAAAAAQGVQMVHCAVVAEVVDGVATTTLTQTLRNEGAREAEADWILPLPDGAAVDRFTMTIAGKETAGEVLDAARARGVYEAIVRSKRDPGLLEHFGRGCLRARIYPIPAQGDTKVVVRYAHVLPTVQSLRRYDFPLRVAGLHGAPPRSASLDLRIRSQSPIGNLLVPSPAVRGRVLGPHEAHVSFEPRPGEPLPEVLRVFFGAEARDLGLDLLTWRRAGEDGYFLLLIAPDPQADEAATLPKSITFVVDVSGSMSGTSLEQAKGALKFFLHTLRDQDRFDVITFASDVEPWFGVPVPATEANRRQAESRIEGLRAAGGTNIEAALLAAVRAPEPEGCLPIVVFLTDGAPTVGCTVPDELLARVRAANPHGARIHVLGVGDQLNSRLLDSLSEQHGGWREYVRAGEDLEVKANDLLVRLSHPVLRDLELSVADITLRALAPTRLPDLYRGSRIAIAGRYQGEGTRVLELAGRARDRRVSYRREVTFPAAAREHAFVPALWAQRRVGGLLDEIRRNGAARELVDEVTALGREFQIVTPYTTHLVLEDGVRPPVVGGGVRRGPATGDRGLPGRSPGPGGPTSAGPSGPATPGAGGPASGRDSIYVGESKRAETASLAEIVDRLRAAQVLPEHASPEELARLAAEIATELRAADAGIAGLTQSATGKEAVDASVYLARMMASTAPAAGGVAACFVRRVGERTFRLRAGVWTDTAWNGEGPKTRVVAFSTEHFALAERHPELRPCLAFSTRLVVVAGDTVYEIVPANP